MVVKELCRAWPDDANVIGPIGVLDKDVQLAASLARVVDVAVVEGRGRNGSVNDGNPVLAQGSQVVDKVGIVAVCCGVEGKVAKVCGEKGARRA